MSEITITTGPRAGATYPLQDSQIIGRLPKCAIPLDDAGASREHARIYRRGGGYFIVDLNSKNGVFVNGARVEKAALGDGDEIQIGETWMRLSIEEESEEEIGRPASAGRPLSSSAGPEVAIRRSRPGSISDRPVRSRQAEDTRTNMAWLRADLGQTSGLYRALVAAGLLLVGASLCYLVYLLSA